MPELILDTDLTCDYESPSSKTYYSLVLLIELLATACALAKFLESRNRFNYKDPVARIIVGTLMLVMGYHTRGGSLDIQNGVIAMGSHKTGALDGCAIIHLLEGKPVRVMVTDAFNWIPGVKPFLTMFGTIFKKEHARTATKEEREENKTITEGRVADALKNGGRFLIAPEGNFAKLGQQPLFIQEGAAKFSIDNKVPLHIVRLDGFWCISNPLLPVWFKNLSLYRALFSFLHMNNIRVTLCSTLTFHLDKTDEELNNPEIKGQLINEMSAQLYAFYRHTEELTLKDIENIKEEIKQGHHLPIWKERLEQQKLLKEIKGLKEQGLNDKAKQLEPRLDKFRQSEDNLIQELERSRVSP